MKQKLLTLFLALVANVGMIYASNTKVDGIWYYFNESNKTATVTYRGSSYNDYSDDYSGSVVIPSSVTYNGITYSVTSIGDYAFYHCTGLTSVTIGNSVTSIGEQAFYWSYSLTSINVDSNNPNYSSVGGVLFNKDKTTLIAYPGGKQGAYTIPNSVTGIGSSAFGGCFSLTSVIIPNSVKSIGNRAFADCSSLTSITIPNSVTSIGAAAFKACSSLTSITIPNSVTSIGSEAFSGTRLYNDQSNWENGVLYISNYLIDAEQNISGAYVIKKGTRLIAEWAFYNCSSLTSITIPNSVTSIGDFTFYNCSSLTSVTIPNSVTSIGEGAFYNCYDLTSITIPNSVTSIGGSAFNSCSSLTSITIPNSVTIIGDYAFSYCRSLTSVTIPNSVTSIGDGAFRDCSSLASVTIGNSVTSIEYRAFYSCTSLTSVTIPNSVTSIGERAFDYCTSLTSVTIGNSVTYIGEYAFSSCNDLTSVTIPNSVTSIGEGAFYNCYDLTSINVNANNPNYCSTDGVLFSKDKTTLIQYPIGNTRSKYIIPNSVTSIGNYAFGRCTSLTSVTIPNSVTSIEGLAFYYCWSLTSVINYATQPQAIETSVFQYVDISACQLHVPSTSVSLYQTAEVWKDFGNIQPIRAEDITDVSETIITPSENEANVTWPSVSGAATYELVIKDKEGNIVCTLIFNANGQLTSIAFNAPSRNGVPAQTQNAGFSFTITGLDSGTSYDLILTAKDNNGNTIEETTIPFQTNWAEGIENVQGNKVQSTKVIKDGQVLILRNGKTYTMQGVEVN